MYVCIQHVVLLTRCCSRERDSSSILATVVRNSFLYYGGRSTIIEGSPQQQDRSLWYGISACFMDNEQIYPKRHACISTFSFFVIRRMNHAAAHNISGKFYGSNNSSSPCDRYNRYMGWRSQLFNQSRVFIIYYLVFKHNHANQDYQSHIHCMIVTVPQYRTSTST